MILDVRTMYIALGTICFIVAAAFCALQTWRSRRDGALRWALGWTLQGGYWVLLGLRGVIGDFPSIVIANTLLTASYSLLYAAVRQFQGRPCNRALLLVPVAATFVVMWCFSAYVDNILLRTIFIALLSVLQIGGIAWALLRRVPVKERTAYWLTGFAFLMAGAAWLVRLIGVLALPHGQAAVFQSTASLSASVAMGLGVIVLSSVGFLLMIRERADEARRMSEQRWATTLGSIGDAVIASDAAGKVTFMNAVAEALTGWTLEGASMKPVTEVFRIVNEHTRAEVENPVTKVLREGMIAGLANHTVLVRKDGTEVPIDDSGAPIRDKDGKTMGVVLVFRDITERKRADEALRESEERYRNLVKYAPAGIYEIDIQGTRFFTINDVMCNILGYSREELLSMGPGDLLDREGISLFGERTRKQLAGETVPATVEYRVRRKDGAWVDAALNTGLCGYVEGKPTRISVVGYDITERKQAGETLQKARDELELRVAERTEELRQAYDRLMEETKEREQVEAQLRQAQKMEALGTMSGGIAHDFNNILAAIIGFTELVADRVPKQSREAHHLMRIMESSLRGRDLVRQMLTFSRKAEQEKKPLRVSSIVKETVRLIRATTPTTISIRLHAAGESGLVLGDPTQIQQVLMNLCTNAAYAMRANGGTLDIHLSDHSVPESDGDPLGIAPGLYVKLAVRDTGVGMTPDIMEKIFDPFFTTKKLGEGTGLGLSVVHGIVKHSDGHITVESGPGAGSTFTVYLPQITGELETGAVGDDELPTGSERILFVDDEEALVEMGEDILAELGYDVTSRMSSTEALALIRADPSRFDLVITDQTMPDMTGVELAKEILAVSADMPIIMCTGFSYAVDADRAKAAGIRAFAMKPLTKREIARTIRKVLDE